MVIRVGDMAGCDMACVLMLMLDSQASNRTLAHDIIVHVNFRPSLEVVKHASVFSKGLVILVKRHHDPLWLKLNFAFRAIRLFPSSRDTCMADLR
jgi:hypothetical protein